MGSKPTCFVLMPISDQDGYDQGHFGRVYDHLIKPACEEASFIPMRADDETKTNFIVIDIIRKIIDVDIAICDLSAKNPNVLYELGLRQAFNKKTVLIKDKRTPRIFDIQGLRTVEYDQSLRIDSVEKDIKSISKALQSTIESNDNDVNSLIQLLSIRPADLKDSVELSKETSLILEAIQDMQGRLSQIETNRNTVNRRRSTRETQIINGQPFETGEYVYVDEEELGRIIGFQPDGLILEGKNRQITKLSVDDEIFQHISTLPF